ncbi:MAG: alpha/beta hydrolase family protein [Limisphaerales bacterium]
MLRFAIVLVLGGLLALPWLAGAAAADPVFDLAKLLATPLNPRTTKTTEQDGIVTEEVMFHSEMDGEKRVEIFAFFSYAKGKRALPAFIWNQGGLGQASSYWTIFGAKRGYAALCIDFPMPGYRSTGGYPIVSSLEAGPDPQRAPIYHGAVALLKAVSYLESRAEVDRNRIGMCGSSWGGFYTTLMTGVDPRLKVGSAMFGTGSLQLGNSWWFGGGPNPKYDAATREHWRTTLDPAFRLAQSKTPIGWFTGANDQFYWMPALMETHRLAAGPKHLTILPNWNHGLTPTADEQVFAWLDVHLKGAPPFNTVGPLRLVRRGLTVRAEWDFAGPRELAGADLILSHGNSVNWVSRYWQTLPAQINGEVCSVELPPSPWPFFIGGAVTDRAGFRYSTPLLRVDADPRHAQAKLSYDGCGLWGGFEPEGVGQLKASGFWDNAVAINTDPAHVKAGQQSAIIKAKGKFHPVQFTMVVPHQLTSWLKSATETEIKIELAGVFDSKPRKQEATVKAGPAWSEVTMNFSPPVALTATLSLNLTAPPGSVVYLDEVKFVRE